MDFWKLLALYICSNTLGSLPWAIPFGEGEIQVMRKQAAQVLEGGATGETVMVTFNFEGLEQEPGVYKEGLGYIWDSYGIPCYNIAADHPYYYHERLQNLPKQYHH